MITRQAQVNRPPKETLKNLLLQHNGRFVDIGKLYNVSDNAVRKWCKFYGLPYHSTDYRPKLAKQTKQKSIPVKQIDMVSGNVIEEFKTIAEAERLTGITHIWDVCYGYRKSAGGYFWEPISNEKENQMN